MPAPFNNFLDAARYCRARNLDPLIAVEKKGQSVFKVKLPRKQKQAEQKLAA